jgi:hypothetical protein
MKPWIHAESSARKFGGKPEDYIDIHNLMDSSKSAIADNRHRALTHNCWFLSTILERIFGVTITNSNGKKISVRDIGEQHVLEDYRGKFIPTAQDFLQGIPFEEWMDNGKGELPNSSKKLYEKEVQKFEFPAPVPNPPTVLPNPYPFDKPFDDNRPRIID